MIPIKKNFRNRILLYNAMLGLSLLAIFIMDRAVFQMATNIKVLGANPQLIYRIFQAILIITIYFSQFYILKEDKNEL